jgi:hypothetical protein
LQMMQQLQQQVVETHTALAELSSDELGSGAIPFADEIDSSTAMPSDDFLPPPVVPEKKKPKRKAEAKPVDKPAVLEEDTIPLTLQEQELLTETINDLPADHLHGVIQIIREAAKLTGEEDEIDLEIDQLDTATQRKLLKHVSKVRFSYGACPFVSFVLHVLKFSICLVDKSLSSNRNDKRLRP